METHAYVCETATKVMMETQAYVRETATKVMMETQAYVSDRDSHKGDDGDTSLRA